MLSLSSPPTHHRYLAEINNLLRVWSRPIYIQGPPRATIDEIRAFVGARKLSYRELWVPTYATRIVFYRNCIALKSAPTPCGGP